MEHLKTAFITTQRLIIRAPALEDAEAIHAAKIEVWEELRKWMSWSSEDQKGLDATRAFIANAVGNPLCGFNRQNGDFVICSGIHNRPEENEFSTGYWVAPGYLGQGYATETTNALLRYAFTALNAKAMHIECFEGNDKSRNVIRKLGFEENGILPKACKQFSSGEFLDEHKFIRKNADNLPDLEVTWS